MRVLKKVAVFFVAVVMTAALGGCSLFSRRKSDDILPHLISRDEAESNPVRPIDGVSSVRKIAAPTLALQYDELLDIVYAGSGGGSRPDFSDADPAVEKVYEEAKKILDRYIRNDFTEFERVHAIHDYLTYYIEYDFDLAENPSAAKADDPSFGLDGVFINKKAVCDGYTKAFQLLCGIEQIRCIRITGEYVSATAAAVNHAWNKVEVDGKWYNVDATMDSWHVYTSDNERTSIINHGYFLLSDDDISDKFVGRHTEGDDLDVNFECPDTYPFHENAPLGIGSHSMRVTSQDELNDVFKAVKSGKRKIGKLELQLAFDEFDSNPNRQGAYSAQIAEAYKKVRNADFSSDSYMRYPNGVFVFLIYR